MSISSLYEENKWLIMLLLNFIVDLKAEDPLHALADIDWKRDINETHISKDWLAYVYKSMERILDSTSYINTALSNNVKFINMKSNIYYFHFSKLVHPKFKCWDSESHTEETPLVQHKFYWFRIERCIPTYHEYFMLHSQLRLNITFIKLNLKQIFESCSKYNLTICSFSSTATKKTFTYCGTHSQYSVYPPSSNISLRAKLFNKIIFELHAAFSVISENVVRSEIPPKSNINSHSVAVKLYSTFYVPLAHINYFIYRIRLKKYMGLLLNFNDNSLHQSTVYAGPEFVLNKIELESFNHTFLYLETFQCILQTRIMKQSKQNNLNITYGFRDLPRIKINLTLNEMYGLSYPEKRCSNTTVCILHLHCPDGHYINLTVLSFIYNGLPNSKCSLGGLAFYDYKFGTFQEELLFCNKYNDLVSTFALPKQSVYSSNSSVLFILYSYKEYSQLKLNGTISVTSCRGVKINICALNYLSRIRCREYWDQDTRFISIFKDSYFQMQQHYNKYLTERGRLANLKKYFLDLLDMGCIVFQSSANVHRKPSENIEEYLPREMCTVHLVLRNVPQNSHLWQYDIKGFLEHNERRSKFKALGHAEYKGETTVVEWNQQHEMQRGNFICNHTKGERTSCEVTSKQKNVLYLMKYYLKTPTHRNTIVFLTQIHTWSHSWTNYIISHSNITPKETTRVLVNISFYPYYIDKVVTREEVVFNMKIFTNSSLELKINVASSVIKSKLKWTKVYQVEKHKRNNILIALPGAVESVTLKSGTGNMLNVPEIIYSWMYFHTKTYQKLTKINFNFKILTLNPILKHFESKFYTQKYIGIKSAKGIYHFITFYKERCFWPQKEFFNCSPWPFSWNEASELCGQINASLPEFYSREEQEELLTFLKISTELHPIERIFIGLKTINHSL